MFMMSAQTSIYNKDHPYQFIKSRIDRSMLDQLSEVDRNRLDGIILSAHKTFYEDYRHLMLYLTLRSDASNENKDEVKKIICCCFHYHLSLTRVYAHSLGAKHDPAVKELINDKVKLDVLINQYNLELKEDKVLLDDATAPAGRSMLAPIRTNTNSLNIGRLLINRLRRLLLSITALNISVSLQVLVDVFDPGLQQVLGGLNLVFFIPRLLSMIGPWIKHLLDTDSNIDFWSRFWGQLHRRWEQVLRDLLWLTVGILSVFVFTGASAILGLYAVVVVQFIEVCLNAYLLWEQQCRLAEKKAFFKALAPGDEFFKQFDQDVALNNKRMQQPLIYLSLFLCSSLLILPPMAMISAYLPLIGATLAVVVTIYQLYALSKPAAAVNEISYAQGLAKS